MRSIWIGAYGVPTRYREVVLTVSKHGHASTLRDIFVTIIPIDKLTNRYILPPRSM